MPDRIKLRSIAIFPPVLKEKGETKEEVEEVPHGKFSVTEHGSLEVNSITGASGAIWEKFGNEPLDGWLYGQTGNETFGYIYSDFRTAFVGYFENGVMVEARATRITHSR